MKDPRCPYCSEAFTEMPKRKKKCPSCGKCIYVRSLPSADHHKVLVTEDGAKEIEKEGERVRFRKADKHEVVASMGGDTQKR